MEKLDQIYLTDLVIRSRQGDSNAFAELYAATGGRVYAYAFSLLSDRNAAAEALRDVMTLALRGLPGLTDPELYLPWVCRICFRRCAPSGEDVLAVPGGAVPVSRVMQLPLAESQVLLMRFGQGYSRREIGEMLNFSPGLIRRCLRSGEKRLRRDGSPEKTGSAGTGSPLFGKRRRNPQPLDALKEAEILDAVFAECGREPNTIPMEALSAYTVYRKERFSLQRGILAAGMILFFLLPLLFVAPRYEVTAAERGERGLPVYTIRVHSLMPVGRVTALLRSRRLPVYEAGARLFTVEPTRNGELKVSVELLNRQSAATTVTVTEVDAQSPALDGSRVDMATVLLAVSDAGIGVNYRGVYAMDGAGNVHYPLSTDEQTGEILFAYPEEDWDVYIPDHIGNVLHLALRLE